MVPVRPEGLIRAVVRLVSNQRGSRSSESLPDLWPFVCLQLKPARPSAVPACPDPPSVLRRRRRTKAW